MHSKLKTFGTALAILFVMAAPAAAQEPEAEGASTALISFSGAIGAAVTIIGAGYGIGKIGSTALESMARQPEVADKAQTAMIIAAALIEGVTLFALVVCLLAALAGN